MDQPTSTLDVDLSRPRAAACPPWCTNCPDDLDPPGALLHRSPPAPVAVYDQACELTTVHVRAAFWDKPADWIGTDPADLERPHVELAIPDGELYLTPGQACAFAAALLRAADTADTATFDSPPTSVLPALAAPASAPLPQA